MTVSTSNQHNRLVALYPALLLLLSFLPMASAAETDRIRVGIYHNPPKVQVAEDGTPTGFWPELTRIIADKEGWQIEWVHGTWEQGLDRLQNNSIDVMVDTALSESRSELFIFGDETVHVSWSRVYAAPGTRIETIPELEGKRIGAMVGSINLEGPEGLRILLDSFAVTAEVITLPDYETLFRELEAGRIDAGVTNRDFGNLMEPHFNVVSTPILFQPADLRYAFSRDALLTPWLVSRFDSQIAELKRDSNSEYYQLREQWLGLRQFDRVEFLPPWIVPLLTALAAIMIVLTAGLYLVEMRVRARTRQLREHEVELQRHEEMLAASQRIAHVGSWHHDVINNMLEWSDETYRILGVSPDTFIPSADAFMALVHPDDRERLMDERANVLRGQQAHDLRYRIVWPDGSVRHVYERAEAEMSESDTVTGLAGIIQDISDQTRREMSLLEYRTLIEGSNELYGVCDAEYRCIMVNQAYADWHGRSRDTIIGAFLPDMLGAMYFLREIKPAIDQCLAGKPQVLETERTNAAGEQRQLLARYYPIRSPADGRRLVAAVITDITELRAQARLVDIAGRVAQLGGWSVDLPNERVTWSDVCADIHGMPHGYTPGLEEAINFHAPEYRDRIAELYGACKADGIPFDDELQIINAEGNRVWVRVVGEPVRDATSRIVRVQGALQDITAQKNADLELERLSERLTNILKSITDAFFTLDRNWCFDYINLEAERLMQHQADQLKSRCVWDIFPDLAGTPIEEACRRAMREGVTATLEQYYPPLGKWFDIRIYPSSEGLSVYFRDVSERHVMMDEINHALVMRQLLINALPAHIALLDKEGNILDVNDQWRHFAEENAYQGSDLGIGMNYLAICESARGDCADEAQVVASGLKDVLSGKREQFALEYPCHSPDQFRWFRVMVNSLGSEASRPGGAVVMHIDITARKLAEQELEQLAYRDVVTELPSRNGFTESLSDQLTHTGWQPAAGLVMLDIEQLRNINDTLGYVAGDQLLHQVGQRLCAEIGNGAIIGRIGGDEFAAYLPADNEQDFTRKRAMVTNVFDTPFNLNELDVEVGARFGYTRLGPDARSVESLLREAELALFHSRSDKLVSDWAVYTRDLETSIHQRIELTRELQHAINNNEFILNFQPKVDMSNNMLTGAEALLRWNHPERGLQRPDQFIPIAEQSQLMGPIGDWVLMDVCRELRAWQDSGLEVVRVSINVSLIQFLVGDFKGKVRDALDLYDVDPDKLTLEITESVFESESEELLHQLSELHDMGIRLSLDDFGTGYSSLLYLQKYPFDEIKIDQGFVSRLLDDDFSRNIVHTVMNLADALGAELVAEGIETAEIRDALLEMGCHLGQGYYFSRPLPASDFRKLLVSGAQAISR